MAVQVQLINNPNPEIPVVEVHQGWTGAKLTVLAIAPHFLNPRFVASPLLLHFAVPTNLSTKILYRQRMAYLTFDTKVIPDLAHRVVLLTGGKIKRLPFPDDSSLQKRPLRED